MVLVLRRVSPFFGIKFMELVKIVTHCHESKSSFIVFLCLFSATSDIFIYSVLPPTCIRLVLSFMHLRSFSPDSRASYMLSPILVTLTSFVWSNLKIDFVVHAQMQYGFNLNAVWTFHRACPKCNMVPSRMHFRLFYFCYLIITS